MQKERSHNTEDIENSITNALLTQNTDINKRLDSNTRALYIIWIMMTLVLMGLIIFLLVHFLTKSR